MHSHSAYEGLRRLGGSLKGRARELIGGDPNRYLRSCSGVIHVGANVGQERELYRKMNLKVIWIEPVPSIFCQLRANVSNYANQVAVQALITDQDDQLLTLHIANNDGESSSILDLHLHQDIWPAVRHITDIKMRSAKLGGALQCAGLDPNGYDALVIDTQGTELLVLKGAVEILPHLKYIKTEAADFESYRNCTTVREIDTYLYQHGFRMIRKDKFAQRNTGGSYFDLLFKRVV